MKRKGTKFQLRINTDAHGLRIWTSWKMAHSEFRFRDCAPFTDWFGLMAGHYSSRNGVSALKEWILMENGPFLTKKGANPAAGGANPTVGGEEVAVGGGKVTIGFAKIAATFPEATATFCEVMVTF
jgi:hypothetical protein